MMKQRKLRVLILSLCALLLFGGTVAGVWAKYVKTTTLSGDITFTAELGEVAIKEYQAVLNSDGTYSLNSTVVPDGLGVGYNDYILLPGVDIPKNAWVAVTDKSPIEAYVYLTVSGTPDGTDKSLVTEGTTGVSYRLASHWKWVSDNKYCYTHTSTGESITVTSNINIPILADNYLRVSDAVSISGSLSLNWNAQMEQVVPTP